MFMKTRGQKISEKRATQGLGGFDVLMDRIGVCRRFDLTPARMCKVMQNREP